MKQLYDQVKTDYPCYCCCLLLLLLLWWWLSSMFSGMCHQICIYRSIHTHTRTHAHTHALKNRCTYCRQARTLGRKRTRTRNRTHNTTQSRHFRTQHNTRHTHNLSLLVVKVMTWFLASRSNCLISFRPVMQQFADG